MDPLFWVGLGQIIFINIILSGDNAVVIALACRKLPPRQRTIGIGVGAGSAVVMRIVLTVFVVYLLTIPFLKIVGGLLLFWIGWKLIADEDEGDGENIDAAGNLWGAIRTVLIADAVMSLDNVIAVAQAAHGDIVLLSLGLVISVPLVVFGATILIKLIERFPIIVPLGAALIGWVGAEAILTDPAISAWVEHQPHWLHYAAEFAGAAFVVAVGTWLRNRARASRAARPVEDLTREGN